MCGRKYNLPSLSWEIYRRLFELESPVPPTNFAPNYNIAPTHDVPVVMVSDDARSLKPMHWGLLPFWAKDKKSVYKYKTFNAKAETLEEKRSYAPSLKSRRCIVPVSGFYEWQKQGDGSKQVYAISRQDEKPLLMAGLWAANTQIDLDEEIHSYTVITREPNEIMKPIHHRMPAILDESQVETWLEGEWQYARECLAEAYPSQHMKAVAVSNDVGKVSNNYPELLEPKAVQGGLFG